MTNHLSDRVGSDNLVAVCSASVGRLQVEPCRAGGAVPSFGAGSEYRLWPLCASSPWPAFVFHVSARSSCFREVFAVGGN